MEKQMQFVFNYITIKYKRNVYEAIIFAMEKQM